MTDKLDKAIADVAYILDCLKAYRSIIETGDCNRCDLSKECNVKPKLGEIVRYNCMFYVAKSPKNKEDAEVLFP